MYEPSSLMHSLFLQMSRFHCMIAVALAPISHTIRYVTRSTLSVFQVNGIGGIVRLFNYNERMQITIG